MKYGVSAAHSTPFRACRAQNGWPILHPPVTNPAISEAEALAFLRAIETGEILLTPQENPQSVYAGNVLYSAANGWTITIFNDANEWDYIDEIKAPDGRKITHDDMFHSMPALENYELSDEIAWQRYGIPGYCIFRCMRCAQKLPYEQRQEPFLCSQCKI